LGKHAKFISIAKSIQHIFLQLLAFASSFCECAGGYKEAELGMFLKQLGIC
jgi:hypothetical protein